MIIDRSRPLSLYRTDPTLAQQIKSWFNNRGRAKTGRGDLKLDVGEGRKLAPLQAYCSYYWSTLRPIVLERWEAEKMTTTIDDDEDPPETMSSPSPEAFVPLAFKLKVAKEKYDELSDSQRDEINVRREADKHKIHRKVTEITDEQERIEKLQMHQRYDGVRRCIVSLSNFRLFRNQPSVAGSLTRVLTNLEDQAGCVAQLFVAFVDPLGGPPTVQKYACSPCVCIIY